MNIYLIIMVLINTLSLGVSMGTHGKERKPENFWVTFIAYIIFMTLLYLAFRN